MNDEVTPGCIRICFFIPAFSDGGAQKQCIALLNELQKVPTLEIVLVTMRPGQHDHLLKTDRIRWIRLSPRKGFDPRTVFQLRRILVRERSEILITWLKASDAIGGLVALSLPRLKWILTERSAWYSLTPRNRLRLSVGKTAAVILANSRAGSQFWVDRGAKGRVVTVDNIVQRQTTPPVKALPPRIVSVGRQVSVKNVLSTAQAICAAIATLPDVEADILGQGTLEPEVKEIIRDSGQGRVHFRGFRDDVPRFMSEATVFISLSGLEGKPNALLEAIAHDAIPVLSRIPEHTEVVGDDYPYLIDADDSPESIGQVIVSALTEGDRDVLLATARTRIAGSSAEEVTSVYLKEFEALSSS